MVGSKGFFKCGQKRSTPFYIRHDGNNGFKIIAKNRGQLCPLIWKGGEAANKSVEFRCNGIGDSFMFREGK